MSCPDLDTLFDPLGIDESKRHVEGCVDCQRIVVMAASVGRDSHRGASCDDAELMIATLATGPLDRAEERWLTEHLGLCRRCANVTRAVLLDPPAAEIPAAPLAMGHKTVRVAIPIAAVAAVVVFALVLFSRIGQSDERPVVAALPVDSAAMPVDAAVAPPPSVDAAVAVRQAAGEADAAVDNIEVEQREARAAIQAAVRGGSLAAAYAGCDKVRGARWLKKCVVLACRARSELQARRFLARLPKSARGRFVNLCLAQGVDVD